MLSEATDGPRSVGEGVVVYPSAKLVRAENLEIGDHSTIDDFAYVDAGDASFVGRYVHIGNHVSIIGRGGVTIGDYGVVAAGARIVTATDTYRDGARMSTHLPDEFRAVVVGHVTIGSDGFVGANAVVLPGVTLGEGAVLGAGAVATVDLEPWTVYAGSPARPISERPRPTRPGP